VSSIGNSSTVAVDINPATRDVVTGTEKFTREVCRRLPAAAPELRWTGMGSWHLTLAFLGLTSSEPMITANLKRGEQALAHAEAGVERAIWALSNLIGEITFKNGRAEQTSYVEFPVLRMSDAPAIETHLVPSHGQQPFGMGEPVVPPVIPAVLNGLFAATGERVRRLPL